jgi:hypothetical protein
MQQQFTTPILLCALLISAVGVAQFTFIAAGLYDPDLHDGVPPEELPGWYLRASGITVAAFAAAFWAYRRLRTRGDAAAKASWEENFRRLVAIFVAGPAALIGVSMLPQDFVTKSTIVRIAILEVILAGSYFLVLYVLRRFRVA